MISWMLHTAKAKHPGPRCPSNKLSIECVNVGSWLSNGDYALESAAGFLVVVSTGLSQLGLGLSPNLLRPALDISLSGPLLARILFLVVMLA